MQTFDIPLLSPNGKYVISHSWDLEVDFYANGMQLYDLKNDSIMQLFSFERSDWGPTDVSWVNDSLVIFQAMNLNLETGKSDKRPLVIKIK
ncbi:MAG: hypothetical protein JKY52_20390 [Flavobacteriales bacterium]|nr:hypothetical protein [Flavobacteriales bacterium]